MELIIILLSLSTVFIAYGAYFFVDTFVTGLKSGVTDTVSIAKAGMMMPDQHLLRDRMALNTSSDESSTEEMSASLQDERQDAY